VEIINAEALATVCGLTSDSQPRPKSVRAAADFAWSSLGCSIFAADVAAFGGPQRNDTDRVVIRTAMYRVLRDAFEESSIRWTACYREDRGDGVLIIVPPTVSTVLIVDPLLALLAAKLRRHNRHASDAVRMQFRVAVHVGPVFSDPEGLSGEALIQTARMLDAPVLKQALAAANADMAFITSTYVYDTIIKHGPGFIDPATYQPVEVNVKESKLPAWLHLSRNPANLQSGRSPVMPSRATNIPETRFSIGGDVRIDGDIVLGNKIELGTFTRLHSGRSNIR